MDFINLEKTIKIDKDFAENLTRILKNDADFLEKSGWLDYSLIVYKVNWSKYCIDNDYIEKNTISKTFTNKFYCIESMMEPGIYY